MDELFNLKTVDDLEQVLAESIFLSRRSEDNDTVSIYMYNSVYIETHYDDLLQTYAAVFIKNRREVFG